MSFNHAEKRDILFGSPLSNPQSLFPRFARLEGDGSSCGATGGAIIVNWFSFGEAEVEGRPGTIMLPSA